MPGVGKALGDAHEHLPGAGGIALVFPTDLREAGRQGHGLFGGPIAPERLFQKLGGGFVVLQIFALEMDHLHDRHHVRRILLITTPVGLDRGDVIAQGDLRLSVGVRAPHHRLVGAEEHVPDALPDNREQPEFCRDDDECAKKNDRAEQGDGPGRIQAFRMACGAYLREKVPGTPEKEEEQRRTHNNSHTGAA